MFSEIVVKNQVETKKGDLGVVQSMVLVRVLS